MSLTVLTDYLGKVHLTAEHRQHILQHPEVVEGIDKIGDVLAHPEWVSVPDLTLITTPVELLNWEGASDDAGQSP
jgi:hypothetical protein